MPPVSHLAFLRAVNVGGRTVRMDRLREILEAAGLSGVETFIASGNVAFASRVRDAAKLERTIESALRDALGYDVPAFVRTPAEVEAVAARAPFGAGEPASGHILMVMFLAAPPTAAALGRVAALETPTDSLLVDGRELYWLRHGARITDSTLDGGILERALGVAGTARNLNTVRKLAAKYGRAGRGT